MSNNLHPIDSRFELERPLKGGVAPSRYEVALHAYTERQQKTRLTSAAHAGVGLAGWLKSVWRASAASALRAFPQRSERYGLER